MRRAAALLLPAVVAVLFFAFAFPPYARFLGAATSWVRGVLAEEPPPLRVEARGAELVVHTEDVPRRIDVESIAWNLPVLLCLWGWVVRSRWGGLAAAVLAFVSLHVWVTGIAIRVAVGEGSGWPLALLRGWVHGGAAAAPLVVVAWAFLSERASPRS